MAPAIAPPHDLGRLMKQAANLGLDEDLERVLATAETQLRRSDPVYYRQHGGNWQLLVTVWYLTGAAAMRARIEQGESE